MDKLFILALIGTSVGIFFYILTIRSFIKTLFLGIIGSVMGGAIADHLNRTVNLNASPILAALLTSFLTFLAFYLFRGMSQMFSFNYPVLSFKSDDSLLLSKNQASK